MSLAKAKAKNALKETGEAAFILLELVASAADACPPLKSAANGALYIAKLLKNFDSNSKDWDDLGNYVQDNLAILFRSLPDTSLARRDVVQNIEKLSITLDVIGKEIEQLQRKSRLKRGWKYAKAPDKIKGMRQRLDESINLFKLATQLTIGFDVATIRDAVNENRVQQIVDGGTDVVQGRAKWTAGDANGNFGLLLERIMAESQLQIGTTIDITALPYTSDSGWNDAQACLLGTRKSLIDDALGWIGRPDVNGIEQLYFVTDVVGSGKTALAHAVAQRCSEEGMFVSSFFFDQKAGRTNARDFVYTLARDLGSRNKEVTTLVSLALKAEPSLVRSRPTSFLFKKVILEPVTQSHIDGPIVVVVDAVDQIDNDDLLDILYNQVPKLPGNFRIFLTSRPERILRFLTRNNIQPHGLGIHEAANLEDIALYIDYALRDIALDGGLQNWPSPDLSKKFLEKAEGLFVWVVTVCEYLLTQTYPDEALETLLESVRTARLPPEEKIDSLYSTILTTCPWQDDRFAERYQQVMGAIVAAKMPLSSPALQILHGAEPRVKAILKPLASLVTGITLEGSPVRILHSSFREFITLRATRPYHIRTKEHSARLAIMCLRILRDIFDTAIDGTGYLSAKVHKGRVAGIPDIMTDHITEEGWYAIRFWPIHIVQVAVPNGEVVSALHTFLFRHLITWIEVLVSGCSYQPLTIVRRWLKSVSNPGLASVVTNRRLVKSLVGLANRLQHDRRERECLDVMEEVSDMVKGPMKKMAKGPTTKTSKAFHSDDSMPDIQSVSDDSDSDARSDSDWSSSE